MIAPSSLAGAHIYFPDPWHRNGTTSAGWCSRRWLRCWRHGLQRVVICIATDWVPYAEQMLEVLSAEPALLNTASDYAPRRNGVQRPNLSVAGSNLAMKCAICCSAGKLPATDCVIGGNPQRCVVLTPD